MTEPTAVRSIDIDADPQQVYALITDLDTLAELADEADKMTWKKGALAEPGNVFVGRNRNGKRSWTTSCTVTEAVPGSVFAFRVTLPFPKVAVSQWRYDIAATETGCRVTESTRDERPGWFKKPAELVTGVRDRDDASARHIEATLERLRRRAEG